MNLAHHYRRVPEWLIEDMDGDLLAFNPVSTMTVHLNVPSSVVWRLCDEDRSVADIIDVLTQAYPAQVEQIAHDVVEVIEQLAQQALIEQVII